MGSQVNLPAVYIADLIGILLMCSLLWSNIWRMRIKNKENNLMLMTMLIVILACIADIVAFASDGRDGQGMFYAVYISNFLLYLANMIIGPIWIVMVLSHVSGHFPVSQKILVYSVCAVGTAVLIVNFFTGKVFFIDGNNVYGRGPLFWLYTVIQFVFIADGIVLYIIAKRKGGILKFFPAVQFVVPIFTGIIIQACFYGVSAIWPCLSVSVCGLVTSLQNENIFIDRLTGIYNRFYLDNLKQRVSRTKKTVFAAMMIDMNGFKNINDSFGHSTGDEALIAAATLLSEAVGYSGIVTRYAGDEFVIVLNTSNESNVEEIKEKIYSLLDRYNKESGKPYKLSVALGHSVLDLSTKTVDELLKEVDDKMYKNKQEYYQTHKEAERRKS